MPTKTDGPHDPLYPSGRPIHIGFLVPGASREFVRHLCEDCDRRNTVATAAHFARLEAEKVALAAERADLLRQHIEWLRAAPLLDRQPEPVGTFEEYGFSKGYYFEILDLEEAGRLLATPFGIGDLSVDRSVSLPMTAYKWDRPIGGRHVPNLVMTTLHNNTVGSRVFRYSEKRDWTGSIYRLDDTRIVLHWHTSIRR